MVVGSRVKVSRWLSEYTGSFFGPTHTAWFHALNVVALVICAWLVGLLAKRITGPTYESVPTELNGWLAATLMMVFKLAQSAAQGWKKLKGSQMIADVIQNVRFVDGIKEIAA